MEKGYIQVYTGNGKGKTTAALGLALRAVGRGYKVVMYQFLKGTHSGELEAAKRLSPDFTVFRFAESDKFFWQLNDDEKKKIKNNISKGYNQLLGIVQEGSYDVIILDEIMAALNNGLLSMGEVCKLMDNKHEGVELILTGRNVPQEIINRADLITEMKKIKHYIDQGIYAREGIEM